MPRETQSQKHPPVKSSSKGSTNVNRRRGEGREQLLQAARDIFAERGYTKASTKVIAARAGYADMMIFRHFGSKANLFAEAVVEPFQQFIDDFFASLAARPGDEAGDDVLRDYVEGLYRIIRKNSTLLLAVLTAKEFEPEALGEALSALNFSKSLDRLVAPTNAAQNALGLRNANQDVLHRAIFGMVIGVALTEDLIMPIGRRKPTHAAIVEEMTTLCLYGMLPPDKLENVFHKPIPGLAD